MASGQTQKGVKVMANKAIEKLQAAHTAELARLNMVANGTEILEPEECMMTYAKDGRMLHSYVHSNGTVQHLPHDENGNPI